MTKRIGVFSDFHTGHKVGLTPPEYFAGKREVVQKQAAKWKWFTGSIKEHGPFVCCLFLGVLPDGHGVKNHCECIITDLNDQIDAVVQIVNYIGCDTNFMLYGTPVHVQDKSGLELEKEIAERVGAEIHGQIWIEVEGYTLDLRHHPAGNSQVYPANPLVKEHEANVRWHDEGVQPLADLIFRGHCHRLYNVGQPNRWSAHAVPALQGVGTRYGRRLSNIVHEGYGILDFPKGMWPIWTVYEAPKWMETPFKL
jgi:hypothetical protein